MWKRLLLSAPLLGTLLMLAAADLPVAHSSAPARTLQEPGPPRDGPYPRERTSRTRCRVCRLAERLGLQMTPLVPRPVHRCMPAEHALTATAPRGRVRLADMRRLRVDVGLDVDDAIPGFEQAPHVEVHCGQTLLGRVPFELREFTEHVDLPVALQKKLRGLRGRIRWGRSDSKDGQAQAHVWIDEPTAYERRVLADIRKRLAREPRWIRQLLEAQALLDQEFDQAAMTLAQAVLARRAREPHAAAILQTTYGLLGLRDLREADVHNAVIVRALHEQRKRSGASCHLDEPAVRLRRDVTYPRGGCGHR